MSSGYFHRDGGRASVVAIRQGRETVELAIVRGSGSSPVGRGDWIAIDDGLALAVALAEVTPATRLRSYQRGTQAALSLAAFEHAARRAIEAP